MDKSGKAKQGQAEAEQEVKKAYEQVKANTPELKEELNEVKVENVSEVAIGEGKNCYLVQMSSPNAKDFKKVQQVIVKKLEDNFSVPIVVIPSRKRINGKLYRKYTGTKVPRERTLAAIFDAYLEDLVYPATVIGKRIRFPKGKVRHFKIMVDPLDKEVIEYKKDALTACYKALTNRTLEIQC